MNRDFKGVWIPRGIYLREDISWTEKILLIEIDSLDKGEGCWASNEHLSKFLGISEGQVANCLTKLRKLGLLVDISFDGRKRFLSLNAEFRIYGRQGSGKPEGRVQENLKQEVTEMEQDGSVEPQTVGLAVPSNTMSNTVELPLSKESEAASSFEDWMQSQQFEYRQSKKPDENECYPDVWYSPEGKQLTSSQVFRLRRDYTKSITPASPQNGSGQEKMLTEQVGKVVDWISFDFQNEFGEVPTFSYKDKMALRKLIKDHGFDFVKEYGRWFFSTPQINNKFKIGVNAFCSSNFINQYKAQKHGRTL